MFGLRRRAAVVQALTALGLVIVALLACKSNKEEPLPDVVEEEASVELPEAAAVPEQVPEQVDAALDAEVEAEAAAAPTPAVPRTPVDAGSSTSRDAAAANPDAGATQDAGAVVVPDASAAVACARECQRKLRTCQRNERAGRRNADAPTCAEKLVDCMATCR